MIIVFGSINIDLVFSVSRLPLEGETVIGPGYAMFHGGKGANQAVAAARYGARVEMVGAVGRDDFGCAALEALRGDGVGVGAVRRLDAPTGCAAIGLDTEGRNQIMVASGANALVSADMVPDELLDRAGVVLAQMEIPSEADWEFLRRARNSGAVTVFNAAPAGVLPEEALPFIDVLIVNEPECIAAAAAAGVDGRDAHACASGLAACCGIDVITTLGARGAALCRPDGKRLHVEGAAISPVDSTGEGDTFCGVLAACLDGGLALAEAIRRANAAGALSCLQRGARGGMPSALEVERMLAGDVH